MARLDTPVPFDTSAALLALDRLVHGTDAALPSAGSAWDAAWIACLTNSPAWAATARDEFVRVAGELRMSGCGAAARSTPQSDGARQEWGRSDR